MVSVLTIPAASATCWKCGGLKPQRPARTESNRSEARALVTSPQQRKHNDQTKHPRVHAQPPHSPRARTHLPLVPQGQEHRSRPPHRDRQRRHRRPRQPRWLMQTMQRNPRKPIPKQQTSTTTTFKSRTPWITKNPRKNKKTKKQRNFFK